MKLEEIIYKVKCVDISSDGKGVVKSKDKIVFVKGLFIGEVADIKILYSRAGVNFGEVIKLHELSKSRIQPLCKICSSCGGCQYQQLNYQTQLKYKTNRVKNAFTHIGRISSIKINPCIGMDSPYHYRNKIQVPFGKDRKGNIIYGFYKENSHQIIPYSNCNIESKYASAILKDIKALLTKHKIPIYNEDSGFGIFRYCLIRTSYHYEDIMVVFVVSKLNFPGQKNFALDLIKLHPEITTIVENENSRHTNVILGEKEKVLYGKGFIKDSILGFDFNISASSFYQINPQQVETLYSIALNFVPDDCNVLLDAYSGVGTIGLVASKKAKKVLSIELVKSSHINAIANGKANEVKNIEFYLKDAGDFISSYEGDIDVVIMDPPRKGSDEKFLSTLIKKLPRRIIYISCDPETLVRDISFLNSHYFVEVVQPVDMFPFTAHVESVSLLCLKEGKK